MKKLKVGIYGSNGHQIQGLLAQYEEAELVCTAAFEREKLPDVFQQRKDIRHYETLDELIADDEVELISLCSPRRADQAMQAIRCLNAGKHVYAEKPCAMDEGDLDRIMATVKQTGMQFHEMAGTTFDNPYLEMRQLVQEGVIGTVVQVLAQKSYPYNDRRPQDEDIDGGLICQNGVHALRFVEHTAGTRIAEIQAFETKLGNPKPGNLHIAASYMMKLENGGVASVVANYLNMPAFGKWGNETVRIFGTGGFIESVDGGAKTRLVLKDKDYGELSCREESREYFQLYAANLLRQEKMPLSLEDELHPTRMVIRAKRYADEHSS